MNLTPRIAFGALALALACLGTPAVQAQPVTNSSLYYRLGGGSPMGGAVNRGQTSMRLGFNTRLNYSCGKFDMGLSWSNVMNGLSNLGGQITGAIQAGIASLPLYILQRAQPGLYQLFQNFAQKADLLVSASLKTCEEMEAQIKSGKDPYEDYVNMAKGDLWKVRASANGDVVQTKYDVNRNEDAQKRGMDWVLKEKAGGVGHKPIRPIRDLSVAGFNVTLNLPTNTPPTTNYRSSAHADSRLVRAFKSPEDLATWAAEVLGDKQLYLCTQEVGCPDPTTTNTATGLGPKLDKELQDVAPVLQDVVAGTENISRLKEIGTQGFGVTPQLIESIRELPANSRAVAVGRVAQELAMHRVVDKALVARAALLSGLSLPEATKSGVMQEDVQRQIDRLTQHVNDLMFEFRIRKEMSSNTALTIMGDQFFRDSQGARVRDGRTPERQPLVDGRVAP
ncbi:integrating conjugative element protein [Pseudorhodoferax sp. Leaf267]|jgi:integrating conjugative element protein (TIGR03755 family)|uniref:integrating conjugative element protein n=1 Tax=Pseudorhodoferax sp. Leaf267 TaxID=1736316 RepID=UPI000A8C79DD|nr:integrating conjugative element protein [Pseudorhodoferax sp. Leaf267]